MFSLIEAPKIKQRYKKLELYSDQKCNCFLCWVVFELYLQLSKQSHNIALSSKDDRVKATYTQTATVDTYIYREV